ncbi:MAG: zinc ABC transporter substrate-binding protein, partial [Cyanobacteria bacterium J06639_1]
WKAGVLLLAGCLVGCSGSRVEPRESAVERDDGDRLSVVATHSVLCDLADQLAGDLLDVTCLLTPGQDPHTFSPSPGDPAAIADADLILYGGYRLAPKIESLLQDAISPAPKIPVYERAVPDPLRPTAIASYADDPEHAHRHFDLTVTAADPHVWHDASHGAAIAQVIASSLVEIAPDRADIVRDRADEIATELQTLHGWISGQVATVSPDRRKLVTTHAAFGYYAEAYGLEVAGALSGLSNSEQPSAQRLAALVDWVESSNIPAIFAESSTNRELIETVGRNSGAIVPERSLFVEGPGGAGTLAPTYQAMLIGNTCTIVEGLGGTCGTDFQSTAAE